MVNRKDKLMRKKIDDVKITEKQAKKALDSNKEEARDLLNDERKMNSFLIQLESKFNAVTGMKEKLKEIPLIVELIRAYMKREYTEIPLGTLIALVSALIYFFSPIDLIPDVIPGIGYIDDVMVIAIALRFAYTDLEEFKQWKENREQEDAQARMEEIEEEEDI